MANELRIAGRHTAIAFNTNINGVEVFRCVGVGDGKLTCSGELRAADFRTANGISLTTLAKDVLTLNTTTQRAIRYILHHVSSYSQCGLSIGDMIRDLTSDDIAGVEITQGTSLQDWGCWNVGTHSGLFWRLDGVGVYAVERVN